MWHISLSWLPLPRRARSGRPHAHITEPPNHGTGQQWKVQLGHDQLHRCSNAMACKSLAIAYPTLTNPRRSARRRVRPALWRGSELTGAFPADVDAAHAVKRVCAGHRPATAEPDDRQNRGSFDTPTRYIKRAPDRRFRWSEALSRTRWQVKDSNLRSFRDGFTVLGRQGCDQQKRLTNRELPCPTTNIRQRPTAGGHPDAA
jgi:hypothetical protein